MVLCENQKVKSGAPAPLALIVMPRSRIDCTKFEVTGTPAPYIHVWNATDAILGAGQLMPEENAVALEDLVSNGASGSASAHGTVSGGILEPDRWHRFADGYVGEGNIAAKWNLRGSEFSIQLQKGSGFGKAGIWVDGNFYGSIDLNGEGLAEYRVENLTFGRRAIWVRPINGCIAIRGCIALGPAAG